MRSVDFRLLEEDDVWVYLREMQLWMRANCLSFITLSSSCLISSHVELYNLRTWSHIALICRRVRSFVHSHSVSSAGGRNLPASELVNTLLSTHLLYHMEMWIMCSNILCSARCLCHFDMCDADYNDKWLMSFHDGISLCDLFIMITILHDIYISSSRFLVFLMLCIILKRLL